MTISTASSLMRRSSDREWHAHDVVHCRRKFFAIAPTFEISDVAGAPVLFCQEKIFRIKDDIRVYSDSSKEVELLRIKQRNVFDFVGVFDIFDSMDGSRVGVIRRRGWRSFFRDEWEILDGDEQPLGSIVETGRAWLRRLFGFLPYTFAFFAGDRVVATFDQHFSFFTYQATMDMTPASDASFDRRLAFAGALLLMAVESKEDRDRGGVVTALLDD